MNESNLIDLRDRPPEERRSIASLGGRARAEKQARRRGVYEVARDVLDGPAPKTAVERLDGYTGAIGGDETTLWALCIASMVKETIEGNTAAARLVFGLAGEAEGGSSREAGEEDDALTASLKELGMRL